MFNWKPKDVVDLTKYTPDTGGSKNNLNASVCRLFNEYVGSIFLPAAMENRRQELLKDKKAGEVKTAELIRFFRQYAGREGKTPYEVIRMYLSDEDKKNFGKLLAAFEYYKNKGIGVAEIYQRMTNPKMIDGKPFIIFPDGRGLEATWLEKKPTGGEE